MWEAEDALQLAQCLIHWVSLLLLALKALLLLLLFLHLLLS